MAARSAQIHGERQRSQVQAMGQPAVCGRSLGQQENQKFNMVMDQSPRDEGPDMPSDKYCDSSATQSSAGYELVVKSRASSPACGLRPAERINNNNISDASKLAAARISSIAIQIRLSHVLDHLDSRQVAAFS